MLERNKQFKQILAPAQSVWVSAWLKKRIFGRGAISLAQIMCEFVGGSKVPP